MSEARPGIGDALQRHRGGLRKFHGEAVGAQVAPELLAKQHLDIGLIVDHENEWTHAPPPDLVVALATAAAVRGRMILNSVNFPGAVSTTIEPACCLTTMSWLMERPSPVPSPAGLVVKNGLNIFSFTSGGIPVPLSRISDFDAVAEVLGRGGKRWLVVASVRLGFALRGGVEAVGNEVEERPRNLLWEQIDLSGGRVKGPFKGNIKALLLSPSSVKVRLRLSSTRALISTGRCSPDPDVSATACS